MRVQNWETALVEIVEKYTSIPFSWENSHCVHMAIDHVRAMRGDAPSVGKITGLKSSKKALRDIGADSLGAAISRHFEPIPVSSAMRGDIGVTTESIVICCGLKWFGRTEAGPVFLPPEKIERAFRV